MFNTQRFGGNMYGTESATIGPRFDGPQNGVRPESTGLVSANLKRMTETIDRAERAVGELSEKLSPVLTPDQPRVGDDAKCAAGASESPLTGDLYMMNLRLEQLMNRIAGLASRVEL